MRGKVAPIGRFFGVALPAVVFMDRGWCAAYRWILFRLLQGWNS